MAGITYQRVWMVVLMAEPPKAFVTPRHGESEVSHHVGQRLRSHHVGQRLRQTIESHVQVRFDPFALYMI